MSDYVEELFALVKQAGGTVRLNSTVVGPEELRDAAKKSLTDRLTARVVGDAGMTASPAREHANCRVAVPIAGVGHLTPAELRVAKYIALGLERKEIALATGLAVRTIDSQRADALKKLGLRNNVDLALWAVRAGYVSL